MNIRLKSTLRSVVCVGNIVAGHCPLPVIWQTLAIDLSLFFGVQGGGFIPEIDLF